MNINGLQKLTLLDYPGKVACTVFLAGCNLRCPFCHNSELLDGGTAETVMDDAALMKFLGSRRGILDGVAFTGGEPLMNPGLPALLERVKALGYPVKLDTNGFFPEKLKALLAAGLLDYVAMDVKNSPEKYALTCGLDRLDISPVRESIALLMTSAPDYEFRTTVVDELHDEGSFEGIAKLIEGAKRCFLQPFTDRDTVLYEGFHAPSHERMKRYAEILRPSVDEVAIRGEE